MAPQSMAISFPRGFLRSGDRLRGSTVASSWCPVRRYTNSRKQTFLKAVQEVYRVKVVTKEPQT